MTVEDLLKLQGIGDVVPSPDGDEIAVVLKQGRTNAESEGFLTGDGLRGDVLLFSQQGPPRNLTNGGRDDSGWLNPVWSPDGQRIALLSTQGGDNVRLYVWEKKTNQLRRLTERGVKMTVDTGGRTPIDFVCSPVAWISASQLICVVMPPGKADLWFNMRSPGAAWRNRYKAKKGVERTVTASILESGMDIPQSRCPNSQLLLLDVDKDASTVLGEGDFAKVLPSPDKTRLALVASMGVTPPSADRTIKLGNSRRSKLGLLTLGAGHSIRWVDGIYDPKVDMSHAWAPDGSALAVVAKSEKREELSQKLFLISPDGHRVRQVSPSTLKVTKAAWSRGSDLLAYSETDAADKTGPTQRSDWRLIDHSGPKVVVRNLTAKLKKTPAQLLRTKDPKLMVGLAGGKLWRLNLAASSAEELPTGLPGLIQAMVWPKPEELAGEPLTSFIVEVKTTSADNANKAEEQNELFLLTRTAGGAVKTVPFARPTPKAALTAYHPGKDLKVYTDRQSDGTFLWTSGAKPGEFVKRLAINEFLGDIAEAERRWIEYRGMDGEILTGLVLLPFGYEKGKRYPLITWVYGGAVVDRSLRKGNFWKGLIDKDYPCCLNHNLLTARGYAVLIPSIPLAPWGKPSDPYLDLPKGVLSAVDKVIDLNIADPDRLAVMGHSYGGYSTCSLITYTHRFKAAIALAGLTNLISEYGTFQTRFRYEDVIVTVGEPWWCESGQGRMGKPPWLDPQRYVLNSPLFHADRVQTPLLIVQGDVDMNSMEQAEEFFTALYRQGKRARFVRYWGEAHVLRSAANIRHMWQQIYCWLDEYLQAKTPAPKPR